MLCAFSQEACLQGNLIAICLEQLNDPHPLLRQWVAICLGRIWQNFDSARWCGVRDSAHEKLYSLLSDPIPEVSPPPHMHRPSRARGPGGGRPQPPSGMTVTQPPSFRCAAQRSSPSARLWATLQRGPTTQPPSTITWP